MIVALLMMRVRPHVRQAVRQRVLHAFKEGLVYAFGFPPISALLLLIPGAVIFGALLLVCTMVGAILTHLFVLHSAPTGPVVLLVLVCAIMWLRRGEFARLSASPANTRNTV